MKNSLPFSWMVSETIDLAPGFYDRRNLWEIIPTGNVKPENHSIFQLNIAHLENHCDNGKITEDTLYSRTVKILDHYEY